MYALGERLNECEERGAVSWLLGWVVGSHGGWLRWEVFCARAAGEGPRFTRAESSYTGARRAQYLIWFVRYLEHAEGNAEFSREGVQR